MKEQTEKTTPCWADYAAILLAAALWGVIGLWNRTLMAAGLSPISIVVVRNFGGMALLAAVFAARDRSVFRVERKHLKYFFGTGVVSVLLFTCCYFTCQKLCSLAVASILLYTAPAIVVVLSALLWKEPVTGRKLLALFLTLAGCACVCGVFGGALDVTLTGVLLGLGAGFFYALYSIFGRYALAHYDAMTVTVWTFLFAGPACWCWCAPARWRCCSASRNCGSWRRDWWCFPPCCPICSIPGAFPVWSPERRPLWQVWNPWWLPWPACWSSASR